MEKIESQTGLKVYSAEEIKEILHLHQKWLDGEEDGVKADLSFADLRGVDLSSANLPLAKFRGSDLSSADLHLTNLSSADMRETNLDSADMRSTNLSGADLRSAKFKFANLHLANLSWADLRWADLSLVNLHSTIGEMKSIKSLLIEKYNISYTTSILSIGCESYTFEEWQNFNDETIADMDPGALEWWTKWKPIIFNIIEMSPAEPTGYK